MLAICKALGHSQFETSNRSAGDVGCTYSLLTVCGRIWQCRKGDPCIRQSWLQWETSTEHGERFTHVGSQSSRQLFRNLRLVCQRLSRKHSGSNIHSKLLTCAFVNVHVLLGPNAAPSSQKRLGALIPMCFCSGFYSLLILVFGHRPDVCTCVLQSRMSDCGTNRSCQSL